MHDKRRFALCALLISLVATLANAQVYKITDLGPLSPTAINIWGQVVGNYNGQAFIWTQSAGPKGLGTLTGGTSSYAASINDRGVVTGTADGPGTVISPYSSLPNQDCSDLSQPFVWKPRNGMQGLGAVGPPDGGVSYLYWCELSFYGTGVNDHRRVVGYTTGYGSFYQWALLWTSASGMTIFGSSWEPTFVNGVSNTGQIVGQNSGATPDPLIGHATSWKSGVTTALVELGGGGYYSSSANGVNDQGQVVGWSSTTPLDFDCEFGDLAMCPMHAVLWAASGGILDLGTLPGDAFSTASNINFFGRVIGSSGNTVGTQGAGGPGGAWYEGLFGPLEVIGRPFIWTQSSGMQDLNTLISASSGWVLNSATGINIWGQIVGSGTLNGQSHGFLLTPKKL
jgi:probable HAF family extracellular repeat protein